MDIPSPPVQATSCTVHVADGQVVVGPAERPVGEFPPAVLIAGEGVTLRVPGGDDVRRLEVHGGERVQVDVGSTTPRTDVHVEVEPGGMRATMRVERHQGVTFTLRDQPPAAEIVVEREVVERSDPPPPTEASLRAALAGAEVTTGIIDAAVARLAAEPDAGPLVVAEGRAPVPGVDSELDVPFANARGDNPFHTVARGTSVATKTPAVPGVDGVTVTGATVPAAVPRDAPLAPGLGVEKLVGEDGVIHLRASVDGRPTQAGAMVIVEGRFTHHGDIDVATGDVDVLGSLAIAGEVGEGRRVRVAQDLQVTGGVDRAHVEAGGALRIGGPCLHATLRAGARTAAHRALLAAVGDAPEQLTTMAQLARQLVGASAARGQAMPVGRVLIALLDDRFAAARQGMAAAWGVVRRHRAALGEPLCEALGAAHRAVDGLGPHDIGTLDDLDALLAAARRALAPLREMADEEYPAGIAYMQSCTLEAGGPLIITGQGVFTSEVFVGGDLRCEGEGSTLRGGVTRVAGDVRMYEIGGDGGARTTVVLEGKTTTPDRLHAQVVHPGVHVTVNGADVVFDRLRLDVRVGVDAGGRAAIS